MRKKEKNLENFTPKEAKFVVEYLVDLVAKAAAERAGYEGKNCDVIACDLMKKPHIRREINKQLEARRKRTLITADRVLCEIYDMAFADIAEAFDENGNLKNVHEMPEHIRRCISSIEIFEEFSKDKEKEFLGYTKKIRFSDKIKNLELLATHLKLLTEKHEVEHKHSGKIEVETYDIEERVNTLLKDRLCSAPN
jgi:phage terminase small subunit